MKIFYAVQATGNGHISRAMELLPYLQQYGSVDIFLSGANSNLNLDAPIKYRSKGISLFYNCNGGLDYWQLIKGIKPLRIRNEVRDLPVEMYDIVLNDFDYITSAACASKKIPSIHVGHQASFISSKTPRPLQRNLAGEWLLKNYVKATHHIGLHFQSYDHFIIGAVVKRAILEANPADENYVTVYLPSYCEPQLKKIFHGLRGIRFEIFSKEFKFIRNEDNITFKPIDKDLFNHSLINCTGIISGGGFETPAEALHLGKKIMAIPIRGQYEQQCNAAALKQMGVYCLESIDESFPLHFYKWIETENIIQKDYSNTIPRLIDRIFSAENRIREERWVELTA